MGVNKPDVRRVIHYGLASTPEAYFQQVSRALGALVGRWGRWKDSTI